MRIEILTIFPDMVESFAARSLVGKAQEQGILDVRVHDLRSVTTDPHASVDDSPYGGGAGMVFKPEPVFATFEAVEAARPLIYLSPSGTVFDQAKAQELARLDGFSLLCGRYEGVDQRIRDHLVDEELSLGDYVLAGGEVAAMVVLEAVGRLVPGVLGNHSSVAEESHQDLLLEYPHYTRPAGFRGWSVPDVLLSGDHGRVARWRRAQSLRLTMARRPDLIESRGGLTEEDLALLAEFDLKI